MNRSTTLKFSLRSFLFCLTVVALTLAVSIAPASAAATLPLDSYLETVRTQNEAVRAAETASRAAHLYSSDGQLLTSPQIFGNAQSVSDEKPSPLARYNKMTTDSYSLGIQQQTDFGLSGKLSYTLGNIEYSPITPKYMEARPALELTQSLWRNGFGSEIRAQKQSMAAGAEAKSLGEKFRAQSLLLEAEANYWSLALARETVSVQKEALARADRLFEWSSRRSRLGLSDKAEFLQAQANQQARRLELRNAMETEQNAQRAFNRSRGSSETKVVESLQPINNELIERLAPPARTDTRADVRAAEQQKVATEANARASKEKSSPTLDVFGTLAFNGFSHSQSDSLDQTLSSDRPTTVIGVRFSAPLDFGTVSKSREGWELEKSAADLAYRRKLYEQDRDWAEITQKFDDAKERLKLYVDLEKAQRSKLEYERDRHARGRTTTQQILLYELDLETAQFGRIRTLAEILQLNAQMKLYGVNHESR